MKLIDKDAVLAEITKIYDRNRSNGYIDVCDEIDDILSFIDTLEVKEVDLEKELESWMQSNTDTASFFDVPELAKYFFNLGLRASNPLTWEDIRIIGKLRLDTALELRRKELESPDFIKFTEEDYCNEVLKRFKERKEK